MTASLRFLHVSQLQFDRPLEGISSPPARLGPLLAQASATTFANIVQVAQEHSVHLILFTGQVLDPQGVSLAAAADFLAELKSLRETGVEVVVADAMAFSDLAERTGLLLPEAVHVLDEQDHQLAFTVDSLEVSLQWFDLSERRLQVGERRTGGLQIGIVNSADGAGELPPRGFEYIDYWAVPAQQPALRKSGLALVHAPGSPHCCTPDETGVRSVALVECVPGRVPEVENLSVSPVRRERLSVSWSATESLDDLAERMVHIVQELPTDPAEKVRLITWELRGPTGQFLPLQEPSELRQFLQDLDGLMDVAGVAVHSLNARIILNGGESRPNARLAADFATLLPSANEATEAWLLEQLERAELVSPSSKQLLVELLGDLDSAAVASQARSWGQTWLAQERESA